MKPRLVAAAIAASIPAAAFATDLYSPSLPAGDGQYLECRILNVTKSSLDVTVTAFMSNGVVAAGPSPQTLAPMESGGFSIPGFYAAMYCKFTFKGQAADVRASIDIFEPTGTQSFKVFNALSAY
jgi:hypothetical protein